MHHTLPRPLPRLYTLLHPSHFLHMLESGSGSVVYDSLWLHGLKSAKLLCPWNSPGKNTVVGCHSLLQGLLHQCNCYSLCICPRPFIYIFGLCFFLLLNLWKDYMISTYPFTCSLYLFSVVTEVFQHLLANLFYGQENLSEERWLWKKPSEVPKGQQVRIYWMLRIS